MARYIVVKNVLPNNFQFDTWHKCHKVTKSSGEISYKVTKESNGVSLYIENIEATPRNSSSKNTPGSVAKKIDLDSVLNELVLNTSAESVTKLLPFIGDNNNAGFVTAMLIDLGMVERE